MPTRTTVTLILDTQSQASFSLPLSVLTSRSAYFARVIFSQKSIPTTINLPRMLVNDFFDFTRWLETGRILHYPHNNIPYALSAAGSRLLIALEVGLVLESEAYQHAAMRELHAMGHVLPHPEALVQRIWTVTKEQPGHPARRLIVSIVAFRTGWSSKSLPVARRPGVRQVGREGGIEAEGFWAMFDEYCQRRRFDCTKYPGSVEEAIQG